MVQYEQCYPIMRKTFIKEYPHLNFDKLIYIHSLTSFHSIGRTLYNYDNSDMYFIMNYEDVQSYCDAEDYCRFSMNMHYRPYEEKDAERVRKLFYENYPNWDFNKLRYIQKKHDNQISRYFFMYKNITVALHYKEYPVAHYYGWTIVSDL